MGLSGRAPLLIGTTVVVAVALFFLLRPNTLTDIGPLDLPGVPDPPEEGEEVLLAVGDIAACDRDADEVVGQLAADLPGTIAVLGDNVYPDGTLDNYRECLGEGWGGLLDRIRPVVGNHDYVNGSADAYFEYFGSSAGPAGPPSGPGEGWYSYDLGSWHVVVLNTNCEPAGGCGTDSPQYAWLEADLEEADAAGSSCLAAIWHHPRFSSGRHGSTEAVDDLWELVVSAGVDFTLHGHNHAYERVAVDGAQQFVVGTGGRSLYRFERDPLPETEARHDATYGLLYLTLGDGTFTWEYLPVGITIFTDAGEGTC